MQGRLEASQEAMHLGAIMLEFPAPSMLPPRTALQWDLQSDLPTTTNGGKGIWCLCTPHNFGGVYQFPEESNYMTNSPFSNGWGLVSHMNVFCFLGQASLNRKSQGLAHRCMTYQLDVYLAHCGENALFV